MFSASLSLVAATAGTISSMIFFTMNTTLNYIAFPSYLLPERHAARRGGENEPPESSSMLLLRQWDATYTTGHLLAPGTTMFSLLAYLVAARLAPPNIRTYYYLASASAGAALPFSILFVIPKNSELYRRSAVLKQRNDPSVERAQLEGQGRFVGVDNVQLIREGLVYSKIRALLPVPAMIISLYAIMMTSESIGIN